MLLRLAIFVQLKEQLVYECLKVCAMFEIFGRKKEEAGTALSLSYYNEKEKKSYEVCYESCAGNGYAHVRMLDEYCDKMNVRFRKWISNSRLDSLVGYALRNGFFSLDSLYQGDVKDGFKYVIGIRVGNKSHVVIDSFGAAPEWLRNFEVMLMDECIDRR